MERPSGLLVKQPQLLSLNDFDPIPDRGGIWKSVLTRVSGAIIFNLLFDILELNKLQSVSLILLCSHLFFFFILYSEIILNSEIKLEE